MPIYEYQCKKCGHRFERIQKFSDTPVRKCPACGAGVERLLSSPAVQFKGEGWYVTDYARKGAPGKKSEAAEGTESAGAKDKDAKDSKTETKPETKAEPKHEKREKK